ncbi:MAG: hypothetical protein NC094_13715 [Bacteroidales bacterium]|nr:hypothetical protein [Lachnoclostridium sp.]MCM1385591.1 hypothetical protein [Lachnoclostridium sp.]MCM1466458.1 hypothetical protein [Bacteroidales bacterium]
MKYGRVAVVMTAVFGGLFLSISYVNPYSGVLSLSELVMQLSGSRGNLNLGFAMHELLSFAMRMAPDFIVEMYLGTLLYQHFCTASIYVFSRYPRRLKWYFQEVWLLGVQILIYQFFLLFVVVVVSTLRVRVQFDIAGAFLLIYHLAIKSMWVFCMALGINLLAVLSGSDFAFLCVMSFQTFCITILGITDNVAEEAGAYLLQLNPMARLVLCWQSSESPVFHTVLNPPFPWLEMKDSLFWFMIFCIVMVMTGAVLIKRHDLLYSVAEEGAV